MFDSNGDGRTLIIAASDTLNPMGVAVGDVRADASKATGIVAAVLIPTSVQP
jgi:hypothetical protein